MSVQVELKNPSFSVTVVDENILIPINKFIISSRKKKGMFPIETKKFIRCNIFIHKSRGTITSIGKEAVEVQEDNLFDGVDSKLIVFENCNFATYD